MPDRDAANQSWRDDPWLRLMPPVASHLVAALVAAVVVWLIILLAEGEDRVG